MLESIQAKIVAVLLPIILGPIIAFAVQGSKRLSPWLDRQHALVKQLYVGLWSLALPALVSLSGLTSLCLGGVEKCDLWNLDWKLVISTFAMALVTHGLRRKPKANGR